MNTTWIKKLKQKILQDLSEALEHVPHNPQGEKWEGHYEGGLEVTVAYIGLEGEKGEDEGFRRVRVVGSVTGAWELIILAWELFFDTDGEEFWERDDGGGHGEATDVKIRVRYIPDQVDDPMNCSTVEVTVQPEDV